ncbi:MAG: hypothetical protein LBF93_01715 [Zoogloeaceae bacterium]|nr:hypothetical protein [Zoogloeaceae bacterium]
MDIDRCAVQRNGFDFELIRGVATFQERDPAPRLSTRGSFTLTRAPATKSFGKTPPLAAVFGNIQDEDGRLKILQADIAAPTRQTLFNLTVSGSGNFHFRKITCF